MKFYESIIIIKPELSDKDIETYVFKIEEILKKQNTKVIRLEQLGKKKIAYEIKREKKGFFILIHFQAESSVIKEISRSVRLLEETLRCFTVRIEEADMKSMINQPTENILQKTIEDEMDLGREEV